MLNHFDPLSFSHWLSNVLASEPSRKGGSMLPRAHTNLSSPCSYKPGYDTNMLSDIECFDQSSKSVYDSNIITHEIFTFGQIICLKDLTNQNKICENFATSILSHFKRILFVRKV